MKLGPDFYNNPDVITLAWQLLGKLLFSGINNQLTAGIIIETEAYKGIKDNASHAYGNRRTKRTEIMYHKGGTVYVYLCYGIHSMFNVVTSAENIPHAILIRALVPFAGEKTMQLRRKASNPQYSLYNGPGKVCMALGIYYSLSGISLAGNTLWIEDRGSNYHDHEIEISPRIGVGYAGTVALLPYRFKVSDAIVRELLKDR